MRTKLIDNMKKRIKRMLWDSRCVQDQESRAALEDKETAGYLDLEVSGDKESHVEDMNSDPEAGEAVRALEAAWDVDD